MAFSTEVLPLLSRARRRARRGDRAGAGLPRGRLAADRRLPDERAGERDWFDLGVTITVEGRDVPFADVFVALANGQSHMLLADGAHFSLDSRSRCARADRGGAGAATSRRRRCGSAATTRGCGTSSPRSASSAQAEAWRRQVRALRRRRRSTPCQPATAARGAAPVPARRLRWLGVPVGTGSAASSPTTWASARRCRRWP